MGYTHYWDGRGLTINGLAWKRCLDDCAHIIALSPVPLSIERVEGALRVEGLDGTGCEAFIIPDFPLVFGACQTQRLPYDVVVVACLCLFSEAGLSVESDGKVQDWDAGADLATLVLHRTVEVPTSIRME
jgi:hypothetical protein